MVKPIFILSLPRSGSTLLQRLLLTSGMCATLGEPSILLRLLGNDDITARRAVYWEFLVSRAEQDMREKWSGYDDAYAGGVRELMLRIYTGLSEGKEWFIDKTPRYTLIAHEIIKVFPDAKFIIIWRHPLAVAASMAEGKSYWYPDEYSIDLYEGLLQLHSFAQQYTPHICQLRYEDLVVDPRAELKRLGAFLGWEGLENTLDLPLACSAGGSLGDHSGIKKYKQVTADSLKAWEAKYDNWYRRRWALKYFSGNLSESMKSYSYVFPKSISDSRHHQFRLFSGLKDYVCSRNRSMRRHRNPVWIRRFSRRYREKHGYFVEFR